MALDQTKIGIQFTRKPFGIFAFGWSETWADGGHANCASSWQLFRGNCQQQRAVDPTREADQNRFETEDVTTEFLKLVSAGLGEGHGVLDITNRRVVEPVQSSPAARCKRAGLTDPLGRLARYRLPTSASVQERLPRAAWFHSLQSGNNSRA